LLNYAHVVVAHRPGWEVPTEGALGELLAKRRASAGSALAALPAGLVHVQPVTQLEISSTDLRDSLRAGRDPKFLVPDSVREIILETECYAESL
jgi:nicotinate-nucleotide adenylyltransferase